ncbi:PAS domain-containing methyl-accepting chemotaxis protein [Uliginosibacterium sp. H3]|uniref:PAS domain-containing methyl-accepting chemotaxis protein n=1 Tax=Uliginosibacterium silvisoli TaxID=3114758 RepID=A0ABU6JZH6_9RHOO|nr:PAS domain-containing methyl-accepting chemotaxis protein [Uliginosibacterium sp. H3]
MFNTQLKQEIAALREELSSVEQVRSSLEAEMIALWVDPQGRITGANANFEKEMRYSSSQVVGRSLLELMPAHVHGLDFYLRVKSALDRGEHFAGVIRLLRGSGEEAWLRSILQPVRDSRGQLLRFSLYASDLTRTIENSREHENLIEALQRSMAVIEFNLQGEVLTANDRFLNAMGYRLDQIRGKHHRLFCEPEEYNSQQYQSFWDKLRRGEFVSDRFKRVDSQGSVVWLEASYNPIIDAHDRLYKVVKFATVITDQVLRENAVAKAAGIAYDTSRATDASAKQGAAVLQQTVGVMHELATHMQDAVKGIQALDQQSQAIGAIVSSIRGIADQTNLLALNAAIEAARAGEQGRGFAVVADEVRQLAAHTSAATEEIAQVVAKNQQLAGGAVAIIDRGRKQTELSLDLSRQASSKIVEIQDGAQRVVDAIGQFTTQLSS